LTYPGPNKFVPSAETVPLVDPKFCIDPKDPVVLKVVVAQALPKRLGFVEGLNNEAPAEPKITIFLFLVKRLINQSNLF
jgi:hypothetical protein